MKYALTTDGLARIAAFLTPRTLLAFDIDGTLAPIVERPWDARVPAEVQRGLGALAARASVAIITGRAIEDARPMLAFAPRYLVGNHGAEGVPGFEQASAHCARVCRAWLQELSGSTEPWRDHSGIVLEDKTYSLTFHFRHAPDPVAAERLLSDRAGSLLPPPTLLGGKYVQYSSRVFATQVIGALLLAVAVSMRPRAVRWRRCLGRSGISDAPAGRALGARRARPRERGQSLPARAERRGPLGAPAGTHQWPRRRRVHYPRPGAAA